MSKNNEVIMFISDLHAPYHHKDAVAFLAQIKKKYKPTRVICIGDEVDFHGISFHDSDPDLDAPAVELERAKAVIKQLEQLFPKMDLIHSNHGSLVYRRAKNAGLPLAVVKRYNEILEVGDGWKWHRHLTLEETEDRKAIYIVHGVKKNSETYAKTLGCNVVQGHYHEDMRVGYCNSPNGTIWGMNLGCLIDDTELAFEYNKVNPLRPMMGTGIVVNGVPHLIPMRLDSKGNWDGQI